MTDRTHLGPELPHRLRYLLAWNHSLCCGLAALVPKKPGPRRAHKLSPEVMAFVERTLAQDPGLRSTGLAQRVQARFGRAVHSRSIERALARREKKRP